MSTMMHVDEFSYNYNRWDSNAELDFLTHWVQDEVTDQRITRPRQQLSYSEGDSDNDSSPLYDQWRENNENLFNLSFNAANNHSDPHVSTKKRQHRTAANQRERKRMKSINDAFDNLRQYIPLPDNERSKLSKVDTLKYAIMYISNMTEILQQYEDTLYYRKKKHSEAPKRVLVKCKIRSADKSTEMLHSLSWQRRNEDVTRSEKSKKVSTRLWMPTLPTAEDMKFLTDPEPLAYPDIAEAFMY